jgi:predicted ATP-dependent serine protease
VTKSGDIAGPKILEHVVDVVLYMEVCSRSFFGMNLVGLNWVILVC